MKSHLVSSDGTTADASAIRACPRVKYLDVARGLGVLAVVLQHNEYLIRLGADKVNDLLSFRLPLLFFVSGLFLSPSKPFIEILVSRTHAILKPYLVVAIVLLILCSLGLYQDDISMFRLLVGLAYGTGGGLPWPWVPMWFLPCLWISTLAARATWPLIRLDTMGWKRAALSAVALGIIGAAILSVMIVGIPVPALASGIDRTIHSLPLNADLVPLAACFVLLGMRLREQVFRFRPDPLFVSLSAAALVLAFLSPAHHIDLNMREYHLWGSTVLALSGIYLTLAFAYCASKIAVLSNLLAGMGESSLFILLFHAFIQDHVGDVPGIQTIDDTLSLGLIALLLGCALPVALWRLARSSSVLSALFFAPRSRSS